MLEGGYLKMNCNIDEMERNIFEKYAIWNNRKSFCFLEYNIGTTCGGCGKCGNSPCTSCTGCGYCSG